MRPVQVPIVGIRPGRNWKLGSGQMSAPNVSPDALAAIRKAVDATLDELEYQLETVYSEERSVEPATLRVEPELHQGISEIGDWDPMEVRSQLAADALALRGVAERLATGSVSSYLSSDELSRAQAAGVRAGKLWDYLRSLDSINVRAGHEDSSARHLEMHMKGLDQDVAELEKAVVTAEAGSVPVVEPYERTNKTVGTVAVAGGIAVVIFLIVKLFR